MEKMFEKIALELGVKPHQIQEAVKLLDEGNTVPFIARYRKELTGELKDEQLRLVEERLKYLRNLEERRESILNAIAEQEKLTPELEQAIKAAEKLQELEDLYMPYKQKKKTLAGKAKDNGLQPLADLMLAQELTTGSVEDLAENYINENVATVAEAIDGAMAIITEDISERANIRAFIRQIIVDKGILQIDFVGDEKADEKFLTYKEYQEPVNMLPSHRILAINRGEKLGALKVNLIVPEQDIMAFIYAQITLGESIFKDYLIASAENAYKKYIMPAMERELRSNLTEKADEQAIKVFSTNLKNLLLQAPLMGHVIMGLDPGYRTGCKMAIIDQYGAVIDHGTYYLTHSEAQAKKAEAELANKIKQHGVTLISIGNGTASYETEQFVSNMIAQENLNCHYIITNEAGASVYSASKLALAELPDLDVTIRGAVSIARRVQDPMAESVKIDPKSIGVGQYQHDVNQKRLSESLDNVVEDVVNYVGVEINTASPAILEHISGISATVAKNITNYRQENGPFKNRQELLKVSRLGPSAFTQCAGFLRIKDSINALDNTPVHPESYLLAEAILAELGFDLADLADREKHLKVQTSLEKAKVEILAAKLQAGEPTVRDIIDALKKPGRDPREDLPAPMTRKHIMTLEELEIGSFVMGKVNNVVDFGAFLDIGLKTYGFLHRSKCCLYNEQPADVLAVGDVVEVEIISVEPERNRIGLAMSKQLAERKKALNARRKNFKSRSHKPKH